MNGHDLIEIPEGMSCLGSDLHDPYASERERPLREVFISTFWISRHPTTRRQFANYLRDLTGGLGGGQNAEAALALAREDSARADFPITQIGWDAAHSYCAWLSAKFGVNADLPTEAEWEKAARGGDDRLWPWGNHFRPEWCCSIESGRTDFCEVQDLPEGASPYGAMHMAGLVWEWCRDYYDPYAHRSAALVNPVNSVPAPQRVVKGGSAFCTLEIVRPACRDWTNSINQGGGDDGFRIVVRRLSHL